MRKKKKRERDEVFLSSPVTQDQGGILLPFCLPLISRNNVYSLLLSASTEEEEEGERWRRKGLPPQFVS